MTKRPTGFSLILDSVICNIAKGKLTSQEFDFKASGPAWWVWKAEELNRMAVLGVQAHYADCDERRHFHTKGDFTDYVHKPGTLEVAFFLAALATENLLKGNLVKEHPEYVKGGRLCGRVIRSHSLPDLAKAADISLEADEAWFCELGTDAINSFGRYPVATNATDDPIAAVQPTFFEVYDRLCRKLVRLILD